MRVGVALLVITTAVVASVVVAACDDRGGLFRQYEYEEEMYLSLDGTATLLVNTSLPALNALRGTSFDARPNARLDSAAIRQYYTSPVTHVTRVSSSRRNNRLFAHVRIVVDDVRRLSQAKPFAWSSYRLSDSGEPRTFEQTVGAAAAGGFPFPWEGTELVAFRLHLPSEIVRQNSRDGVRRGNILEWEQPIADRLEGVPLTIEARMKGQSILYRTLLLFGGALVAVAALFGGLIWWIPRSGKDTKDGLGWATRDTRDTQDNTRKEKSPRPI